MLVDIAGGVPGLLGRTGPAVYRGVDAPDGGMLVAALQPHRVLTLGPDAFLHYPEPIVHRLEDGLGLIGVWLRVFAYQLCDASRETVAAIVVGRTVGDGSPAIVEGIRGPDAAVGIVEVVAVGVVVALLPGQVRRDDGPHPSHIGRIGIVLEVPQQLVDVVQVHVVVVHLVVALGVAADIAVGVHLRAPLLFSARQVHLRILRGMWNGGRHLRHLALGVGIEVADGSVLPAQHIAQIACAPACQRHAPADAAVEPRLSVPVAVGSQHEGSAEGVDIGVGGIKLDAGSQIAIVGKDAVRLVPGLFLGHRLHLVEIHLQKAEARFRHHRHLLQDAIGSLEASRLVCPDVTIPMQLWLDDGTDDGPHTGRVAQRRGAEAQDGTLTVMTGYCRHLQRVAQLAVIYRIIPGARHSPAVVGLAWQLVQLVATASVVQFEADIPVMPLLDHSKHGTV